MTVEANQHMMRDITLPSSVPNLFAASCYIHALMPTFDLSISCRCNTLHTLLAIRSPNQMLAFVARSSLVCALRPQLLSLVMHHSHSDPVVELIIAAFLSVPS
jgi:hypothetical protein